MTSNIFTNALLSLSSLFTRATNRKPSSPVDTCPLSPATSDGSTAVASGKSSIRSASTAVDNGINDLALGKEVACGPYGPRFRAHDLTSNRSEVCLEKITKKGLSKTLRNLLMQEIRLSLSFNRGSHIPGGIIRAFEDEGHHYLVRRPFARTLAQEIKTNGRFIAQQSVLVLAQMVLILDKLHSQRVYPADLSPSAFVIDQDGLLSLGHLCGARDITAPSYVGFKDALKTQAVYEYGCAAPEVILGGQPNHSTVVFGLAACWHYIAFGLTKYDPATGKGQILKDLKERTRYPTSAYPQGWNAKWEEHAYNFMDKALLFDPSKRIWMDALKGLPILRNVNWMALKTTRISPRLLSAAASRSSTSRPFPSGKLPTTFPSQTRKLVHNNNTRGARSPALHVTKPSRTMSVPVKVVKT
ncbi:kinase-like protein [Stereum hirsutum FP-91666 SS1]|uniref:Kinase-like protein n=1 Tax=Stereum hirsutum (strain FP-91666) TaxID=721885 RepID=R7S0R5_STEHR|nr:kinase-like protein [Stereum hirsutum FP-91666 SS1]EIM80142.1 kinase-like protein [Stereum hirsutum FP-91666 SS1]